MKAVHLYISGRVQGVWYRKNTQETAHRLGLMGWVRNMEDGAVEVHAQGEDACVYALISWCYKGPPCARVDRIDVTEAIYDESLKGFSIRF